MRPEGRHRGQPRRRALAAGLLLLATLPALAPVVAAAPPPATEVATPTSDRRAETPRAPADYRWGPYRPWRVGSGYLCVEQTPGVDSSGIPMYSAAHQWGDRSAAIWVRHENDYFTDDCWQNGYATSQILQVEMVAASDGLCFHFYRNVHPTTKVVLGTIAYLNVNTPNCWSTYERKSNYASKVVGEFLGMATSTVTVSVMGPTWDKYHWAEAWDMAGLDREKYWFWRKA